MTISEKEKLKTKIEETIKDTAYKIAQLEEVAKPVAPENAIGRVSRMDAINNKSVGEAALRMAQRKLANLKHALANIDKEGFGRCKQCKNPIRPARLMFMPQSPYCVRCAERIPG